MKTKEPLNTNATVKAPDTLSVLREHYLQIVQTRAQLISSSEFKSWLQNRNRADRIIFQN